MADDDPPPPTPPPDPHASAPADLRPGLAALSRGDLATAAECARARLATCECYDARWCVSFRGRRGGGGEGGARSVWSWWRVWRGARARRAARDGTTTPERRALGRRRRKNATGCPSRLGAHAALLRPAPAAHPTHHSPTPKPSPPAPHTSLAGRAAHYACEPATAIAEFEAATRLAPARLEAWEGLAAARAAGGDHAGAAAVYDGLVRSLEGRESQRERGARERARSGPLMRRGGESARGRPRARAVTADPTLHPHPSHPHLLLPLSPHRSPKPRPWAARTRSGKPCGGRQKPGTRPATRPPRPPACARCSPVG